MKTLVIRADADSLIGTGHVMRCLALAQAWQDAGGAVLFLVRDLPESIRARLADERMKIEELAAPRGTVEDGRESDRALRRAGAEWLVVDGYHFGEEYQRVLKDEGVRFLYVDDTGHLERYHADLILNQNVSVSEDLYRRSAPGCELLLGARFALLRREFVALRGWSRDMPASARRILLTFGGADPVNVTGQVVDAVKQVARTSPVEVRAVVGPANPRSAALRREASSPGLRMEVLDGTSDMPRLMTWADLCVAAAGSTAWELCFLGLPSIFICISDNQVGIAQGVAERGAAVNMGWHADVSSEVLAREILSLAGDEDRRRRMSAAGRKLVDGMGAGRVVRRMLGGDAE